MASYMGGGGGAEARLWMPLNCREAVTRNLKGSVLFVAM